MYVGTYSPVEVLDASDNKKLQEDITRNVIVKIFARIAPQTYFELVICYSLPFDKHVT